MHPIDKIIYSIKVSKGSCFNIFSPLEFLDGINIELEHGTVSPKTNVTNDNLIMTAKIALAHLNEFPNYYNNEYGLPAFEKKLKEYLNQQQEIKHQEAVIEKLRSFNREKSIKRAESREKMLEKMELVEKPLEDNNDLHLPPAAMYITIRCEYDNQNLYEFRSLLQYCLLF